MKYLTIIFAVVVSACTSFHYSKGTTRIDYVSAARNKGVSIKLPNGQELYHCDDNDPVPVYDALGRLVGTVAAGVAETLIAHGAAVAVTHGAANGVQLLTAAMPPTLHHFVTRSTNRVAATPTPKS